MAASNHYRETADYLRRRLPKFEPEILIILGSGLGFMTDKIEKPAFFPYKEIPNFKKSTAPGHRGRLAAGRLSGKNVLMMEGRFHLYEGYTPEEAAFPVRVANLLGAKNLVVTCAAGAVNKSYKVGDLVALSDFISFTHPGPLIGFDDSEFKTRFVDMTYVFDKNFRSVAKEIAQERGFMMREGVYFYMPGPQFETPAEIRAIRTLGGDLVGMSTVQECVMAMRCSMRVAGIALVTNYGAGVLDLPISEGEVFVEAKRASAKFADFLMEYVKRME